jgi:hypothetical protein
VPAVSAAPILRVNEGLRPLGVEAYAGERHQAERKWIAVNQSHHRLARVALESLQVMSEQDLVRGREAVELAQETRLLVHRNKIGEGLVKRCVNEPQAAILSADA